MIRKLLKAGSAVILAIASAAALAQAFPNKLVKFVVPFPPAGGVDILTRAVAAELSKKWGQPIIVENKPGAGSIVGADFVARSPADGYTLLATVNQTESPRESRRLLTLRRWSHEQQEIQPFCT